MLGPVNTTVPGQAEEGVSEISGFRFKMGPVLSWPYFHTLLFFPVQAVGPEPTAASDDEEEEDDLQERLQALRS